MRKFNVTVNGKSYAVEVEEDGAASVSAAAVANPAPVTNPAPVEAAPEAAPKSTGGTLVTSPMPGLILKLNVANGATVKKGDKIIVLEAMKMENDIVANADGIVNFLVKQGDNVDSGAELASIK